MVILKTKQNNAYFTWKLTRALQYQNYTEDAYGKSEGGEKENCQYHASRSQKRKRLKIKKSVGMFTNVHQGLLPSLGPKSFR